MIDETLTGDPSVVTGRYRMPRLLLRSAYFRNNVFLFAAGILVSFLNYLAHPLMIRLLGVGGYGIILSVSALSTVLLIPTQVVVTVVARHASLLSAKGNTAQLNDLVRRLTAILLPVGVAVAVCWAAGSRFIATFLHLTSVQPVLIIAVSFAVAFVAPVNNGVLQGLQRFSWAAPLSVLPIVVRLLLTVALVMLLGLGVNGALLAAVISSLIAYLISFQPLRGLLRGPRTTSGSLRPLWVYGVTVVIAVTSNTLLFNVDIILAGHFLPAPQAGLYDALATLGKTVLFISTSVTTALLPKTAELDQRGENATRVILQSMFGMLALSALVEIVFFTAPGLVVHLMLGPSVMAIAGQLPWYGLAMLLFAPAQAIITYFLAVNDRLFAPSMVACCALQAILIVVRHQTIAQLVQAAIIAHALLLVTMLALFAVRTRHVGLRGTGVKG